MLRTGTQTIQNATISGTDGQRVSLRPDRINSVGRHPCADILIPDRAISRVHGGIFWDGHVWTLFDVSRFGTLVNGAQTKQRPLESGDVIRFADASEWVFEIHENENIEQHFRRPAFERLRNSSELRPEDWMLVGSSTSAQELRDQVRKLAENQSTVLVRGEFGTGKHQVIQAIYHSSVQSSRPIIFVDCRQITAEQIEQEYSLQRFEQSLPTSPGVIVWDDIDHLSPSAQRVLAELTEKTVRSARDGKMGAAPVRLMATSRGDLSNLDSELVLRLGVAQIVLDPLRERLSDLADLVTCFINQARISRFLDTPPFEDNVISKLCSYDWPNNLHELRIVVETALINMASNARNLQAFDFQINSDEDSSFQGLSLAEVEKRQIQSTLETLNWKKSRTAETLGIERSTLDRKIKRYELKRGNETSDDTTRRS